MTKIAVSDGYRHFGLIFWQMTIGALLLGGVVLASGRKLPMGPKQIFMYVLIAFIGTLFPNSASYEAARHLPAGILSIAIAMVPMFAFPIALGIGMERWNWLRVFGLLCGVVGIFLLIGPEASLPDRAMVAFIPLALVAPFFYGIESNVVGKYGTAGLDPIQLLCGASIFGAALSLPLAVSTGQWITPVFPLTLPDYAVVGSGTIHAIVYCGYVWMVGVAGPVFASQVAYLVTGFGIVWSMILLGERYSGWVWLALAIMFVGLFLVQPRNKGEDKAQ